MVGMVELVGVVGVEELVGVLGRCRGPVVGVVGQWWEWWMWWVWWVMVGDRWVVVGGRSEGGGAGRCDGCCAGCWVVLGRVGSGRLVLILSCVIALNALCGLLVWAGSS